MIPQAHLLTMSSGGCQRSGHATASVAASPELQLQQTLPDVAAVESEQRADVRRVGPHVLRQTQEPQEAADVRLHRRRRERRVQDGSEPTQPDFGFGNVCEGSLTTEGVLKIISSKLPSNMELKAGSKRNRKRPIFKLNSKDQRRCE